MISEDTYWLLFNYPVRLENTAFTIRVLGGLLASEMAWHGDTTVIVLSPVICGVDAMRAVQVAPP
jgi:hypothetical protein